MFAVLVEYGATVSSETKEISCADWNTAMFFKTASTEVVTRCLEEGGDLKPRPGSGWTALHFAAAHTETASVISTLLDAGADLNARTSLYQHTPLHTASYYNTQPDAVAALLQRGADPDARARQGTTPLHYAATFGKLSIISSLLDGGADPNARDTEGVTPLHEATVRSKDPAVIDALLDGGADPMATTEGGVTPGVYWGASNLAVTLTDSLDSSLEGQEGGRPCIGQRRSTTVPP